MKGTQADITRLLWFGPCQLDGWVFDESVLSLWVSLSCPWLLNITRSDFLLWHSPPVDERLTGSNASCPNRLVGLRIGSRLSSFVGRWLVAVSSQMIDPNLISTYWAETETYECIWMTCQKKDFQWHQKLQKSLHCIKSFPVHCFNLWSINI